MDSLLLVDRAIMKFALCKKKLSAFTNDELLALPKSFLVYFAAGAVKEMWDKVPVQWKHDPLLSELRPCKQFDHHQQSIISRIPAVKDCHSCKLLNLYNPPTKTFDFISNYHGCDKTSEKTETSSTQTQSASEEDFESACWAWCAK